MSNKMLIDATHPEETRVVVVRDKRVEDFDFETASKRPLRGNIYLAKVTRVEPSLQAAFVEYGGNRHGFLAFSEIHPDYYQIPQADRAALLADERAAADDEEDAERGGKGRRRRRGGRGERREAAEDGASTLAAEASNGDAVSADAGDDEALDEDARDDAPEEDAREETQSADTPEADEGGRGRSDQAKDDEGAPAATDAAVEPRDGVPPASEGPGRPSSDEGPADIGRAIEQVRENIDADTETATDALNREGETADEPRRSAEPGEGYELSEATHDAATEATEPAEVPGPADPEGAGPAPKPRRKRATAKPAKPRAPRAPRTKKTAEGLADPEVTDADDEDEVAGDEEATTVTSVGGQDAMEEIPERRRMPPRRNYKIQEVIKRRQILLVQVVKEERGTKGAALTTYLSLAGRYSVLMPNTDRGGGVSRKITDNADRKRLKELMEDLEVPEGMGIILRTAGAARTKTEIKRDFEYLLRLWESVRELTLKSIAPKLVYEEGNLVKRAIRDLYGKEIDEILVAGEPAHREAREFMHMLMPSHAKNVKLHQAPTPIFTQYGIEPQLDAMFSPQVTLPSKGYIVINPTEALVSIDVNSGRSTKESNIEETAYKTNLEAADEVARQLRLRDLAGLIVIDFIDMEDKRHNRAVEKRLKDALKLDRSRIQVGHISPFGLLEMSRQRIRQGMVETSMVPCPSCSGTGHVRSTQSVALHCLRALEEHLLKNSDHHVTVRCSTAVALYILNQKRGHLNSLEQRFGLTIGVEADETIGGHLSVVPGARVERVPGEAPPIATVSPVAVSIEDEFVEDAEDEDEGEDEEAEAPRAETQNGDAASERSGGRRRRRRRRRGGGAGAPEAEREAAPAAVRAEPDALAVGEDVADDDDDDEDADEIGEETVAANGSADEDSEGSGAAVAVVAAAAVGATGVRGEPAGDNGSDNGTVTAAAAAEEAAAPSHATADAVPDDEGNTDGAEETEADAEPVTAADVEAAEMEAEAPAATPTDVADGSAQEEREPEAPAKAAPEQKSDPRPRRVGWWQRRSFF